MSGALKQKPAKMKIKKGDRVVVIAGKDKGAKGTVVSASPQDQRVVVEGVNMITKHTKVETSQRGSRSGGIVTKEAPLHVSNVMVLDSKGNPTRVGYRFEEVTEEDGRSRQRKVRVARSNGEDL